MLNINKPVTFSGSLHLAFLDGATTTPLLMSMMVAYGNKMSESSRYVNVMLKKFLSRSRLCAVWTGLLKIKEIKNEF